MAEKLTGWPEGEIDMATYAKQWAEAMTTKESVNLTRPCPCCLWTYGTVVCEPVGLPRVVCCTVCGMAFADTPHDQAWYDEYYAKRSKYAAGFDEWNAERYVKAANRILQCLPKLNTSTLDVGCATGGLMKYLGQIIGCRNVFGIDPSAECVEIAKQYGNVMQGNLHTLQCAQYDCVILSHVLEHIRDVAGALRKLTEIAESVYIEVPDVMRYADSSMGPGADFNAEHINHWSLPHLSTLFVRHGYELRACGEYTCDPEDYPAIWAYFGRKRSALEAVRRQVDKSATMLAAYEAKIRAIDGPVICWGIGELARRLEPALCGKCGYAVDGNGGGDEVFCGLLVDDARSLAQIRDSINCPVLITTVLHQDSVLKQIAAMGLPNNVVTLRG